MKESDLTCFGLVSPRPMLVRARLVVNRVAGLGLRLDESWAAVLGASPGNWRGLRRGLPTCRTILLSAAFLVFGPLLAGQAGSFAGVPSDSSSKAAEHEFRPAQSEPCFPVEHLSDEDKAAAEELFLKILDSEGLYTVIGGTKPASSGFVRFWVNVEQGSLANIDRHRRLLENFRCLDSVYATVHHFAKTYTNSRSGTEERPYEGIVFARPAVRRLVRENSEFFGLLGITEHSHPLEVLMAVEYANQPERWGGYGRLFGFPREAVEFFVRAGEHQRVNGRFVPRKFIYLPTYSQPERGFVYAVAEGAPETEEDRKLRHAVEQTLGEYKRRRDRYIGPGKGGVVGLLRDWFAESGPDGLPPVPKQQPSGQIGVRVNPSVPGMLKEGGAGRRNGAPGRPAK